MPVLAVLSGLGAVAGPEQAAAAAACTTNKSITVTPDTALDDLFQRYGDAGRGHTWTGGDGTESVALPDGRELWLFDDTFLGSVKNGRRALDLSPYLHDSLVVEDHGVLTKTFYRPRAGRPPVAYVNPVPSRPFVFAFWPGPAVVNGDTLQVLGGEEKFRNDATFTYLGTALATFALPSLRPLALQLVPNPTVDWVHGRLGVLSLLPRPSPLIDWAGSVLRDGGYTYIYGKTRQDIYAARVRGISLTGAWSYYDGHGWDADPATVAPIAHVGTMLHFSVSSVAGAYLLVASPATSVNTIVGAFSCSPIGPFDTTRTIYTTPESGQYPLDDGVITYGAHVHPELSPSPTALVVSYDVNPKAAQGISSPNASIYRPRFIVLHVG